MPELAPLVIPNEVKKCLDVVVESLINLRMMIDTEVAT